MTDLDAINESVARKMGWQRNVYPSTVGDGVNAVDWTRGSDRIYRLPDYARDIAAAWEIVKGQTYMDLYRSGNKWECAFHPNQSGIIADTAPLAICKAFLALPSA